jgi:putative ABC transport system substrate-binding protein
LGVNSLHGNELAGEVRGDRMIDRRRFIAGAVSAALALHPIAKAQRVPSVRRIGELDPGAPESEEELREQRALRAKFGWIEGENLVVERRYANNNLEALRPLADELVRLKVELILASGTPAALAAKSATRTIPIVFQAADAVRAGIVASLARPGSNLTGCSFVGTEINVKRLEILRECVPAARLIGILEASSNPYYRAVRDELLQAARSIGVQPIFVEAAAAGDLANAVAEAARRGAQGLLLSSEALFQDNRVELMRAVLKHALPTATSFHFIRDVGALISYDPSDVDERVESLIDRILRGAKPADLPVEQPTKFELRVNLMTAKMLGIAVPKLLLYRAHEVIE